MGRLLHLNLENNTICRLGEETLITQKKLQTINLRNNRLKFVPESSLQQQELRHLDLGGNPLNCDCQLLWLFEKSSIFNSTPSENHLLKQANFNQTATEFQGSQLRLDLNPLDDFENCISLPRRLSRTICQSRVLTDSFDPCSSKVVTTESPQKIITFPTPTYIPKSQVPIHNNFKIQEEIPQNDKTVGNVPTVYAEIRKRNISTSSSEKTAATGGSFLGIPLKFGLNLLPALIGVGSIMTGIYNKQNQHDNLEKDPRTPIILPAHPASLKIHNLAITEKPSRGPDRHKLPWAQISSGDSAYPIPATHHSSTVIPLTADLNGLLRNQPVVQTRRPYIPLNAHSSQVIFPEVNVKTSLSYDNGHWIPGPIPPKFLAPTPSMKVPAVFPILQATLPTNDVKSSNSNKANHMFATTVTSTTEEYDEKYIPNESQEETDDVNSTEDIYYDYIDEQPSTTEQPTYIYKSFKNPEILPITTQTSTETENISPEEVVTEVEEKSAISFKQFLADLIHGRHTSESLQDITTESAMSISTESSTLKIDSSSAMENSNFTTFVIDSIQIPKYHKNKEENETQSKDHVMENQESIMLVNNSEITVENVPYQVSDDGFLDNAEEVTADLEPIDHHIDEWLPTLYEINDSVVITDTSLEVTRSHATHWKSLSVYYHILLSTFILSSTPYSKVIMNMLHLI